MPKISEAQALARRQQIIDAAYRCFARKGFHQTTMRDIYEEATLSPGAVYHYFDSKHEIIAASFDFDYQRSLSLFHAALESADPLKALAELLEFLFTGLKEAAALGAGRVNVQGWGEALVTPSLQEKVRHVLDLYRDVTAQIIRRAQAAGQIDRSLDPIALSHTLLSLYYGLELQLALDPELDVIKYAEVVRKLLHAVSKHA
jgi:AcrR family transcriptional regulator